MEKYRTDFEMQIIVEFQDVEKAKKHFINSEWGNCFWKLDDLSDVAEMLSNSFYYSNDVHNYDGKTKKSTWIKFMEGFGSFERQDNYDSYKFTDKNNDCGDITIRYDMELDPTYTYNMDE
ncbi:MAG: hypothetical protein GQ557_01420 [Mycoplasmataceae bacterium]|nr:hypothetical protein [Mycoplasmataceae bacterium]